MINSHLHDLRKAEFDLVCAKLPFALNDRSVLEVGSGTGFQLDLLKSSFKRAMGIDVNESNLRESRTKDVILYDGKNIPFDTSEFNTLYSSNCLEHIPHLVDIDSEFHRVLDKEGFAVHVLPSHIWKFWTLIAFYANWPFRIMHITKRLMGTQVIVTETPSEVNPDDVNCAPQSRSQKIAGLFFPERHGERGSRFTEFFYFHPSWWKRFFKKHNWEIVTCMPVGLFYTGESFYGSKLSIERRKNLARTLGSACTLYILKKKQ